MSANTESLSSLPLSPPGDKTLTTASSVPIPTSLLQSFHEMDEILRTFRASCRQLKSPAALTVCGLAMEIRLIHV